MWIWLRSSEYESPSENFSLAWYVSFPAADHLRHVGVGAPAVLVAVLPVGEVRPLVRPALEREVRVEHAEAAAGLAAPSPAAASRASRRAARSRSRRRTAGRTAATSSRARGRRDPAPPPAACSTSRDSRTGRRQCSRRPAARSSRRDCTGFSPRKPMPLDGKAAVRGLGDVGARRAREELARHILRRVHREAVDLNRLRLFPGEDFGAAHVGEVRRHGRGRRRFRRDTIGSSSSARAARSTVTSQRRV